MSRDQDLKTVRKRFLGLFPTLNNLCRNQRERTVSPPVCMAHDQYQAPGLKWTPTQSSETKAEPSLFLWLMVSSR